MRAVIEIARQLATSTQEDDILGLAAELAYRFLFALFPLLIVIAAIGGLAGTALGIEDPTDRAMQTLRDVLPPEAEETVTNQLARVLEQQNPGLLSLGLVLALWAASGGVKALMKAMDRAYAVENSRPFIRKNLVALGITLLLGVSIIGGFTLLAAGQFFATGIAGLLGLEDRGALIIQIVRWPLAAMLLLVGLAFVYWAAPSADIPFRWITPGAVLFIVAWLLATAAFAFYVANFGAYADTYGALGGVIVLMLWFYITALVLLVGAELNAVLAKRNAPEEIGAGASDDRAGTESSRHGRDDAARSDEEIRARSAERRSS